MKILATILGLATSGLGAYAYLGVDPEEIPIPVTETASLEVRVAEAFQASTASNEALVGEMQQLTQLTESTSQHWETGFSPMPIVGEQDRVDGLIEFLDQAVLQGKSLLNKEGEVRSLIQKRSQKAAETVQVFNEAANDFRSLAEKARFEESTVLYTAIANWFQTAAAYHERQAAYLIPAQVGEQIERVREVVDALELFKRYLAEGGSEYFFKDQTGIEVELHAFFRAVTTVTEVLTDWTTEIARELENSPNDLPPAMTMPKR